MTATITPVVQIAWDGSTFGGTGLDDITAYVREASTFTGRQQVSQLTGKAQAGTMDLLVKNLHGEFSPLHSNFLGAASTTTNLPARLTINGTSVWRGLVDDIAPFADLAGAPMARISCLGPLAEIGARTSNCSPSTSGALTSVQVASVLDAIEWSASLRAISTGSVATGWWISDRENALDALRKLEDTELGFLCEGTDGSVVFQHRYYRDETSRCTTSQGTFSDALVSSLRYNAIRMGGLSAMRREQYDHVTTHITTSHVGTETLIYFGDTGRLGLPVVPAGESRDITVVMPKTIVDQFNVHSGATTFFPGTPFSTNWNRIALYPYSPDVELDPSTVTAAFSSTTATTATITITNTSSQTVGYQITVFAIPAFVDPPVEVADGTGHRDYPFPGNWFATDPDARAAIAWILAHFALPRPQLSIDLAANRSATQRDQCITRQLSDRIKIVATGRLTQFDEVASTGVDCFIESIRHHLIPGRISAILNTTFDCLAVNPITPDPTVWGRWNGTTWDHCVWA
jgi:hypothetical protein